MSHLHGPTRLRRDLAIQHRHPLADIRVLVQQIADPPPIESLRSQCVVNRVQSLPVFFMGHREPQIVSIEFSRHGNESQAKILGVRVDVAGYVVAVGGGRRCADPPSQAPRTDTIRRIRPRATVSSADRRASNS